MGETMLRDPRQPVRRTPGIRLDIPLDANETPEKIAWTAAFLQILGVTSKHDTQGALQMDMLAVCKKMEEQTLSADPLENPYCAANLSVEASLPLPAGLKPGPEFMAYLKALKAYEVGTGSPSSEGYRDAADKSTGLPGPLRGPSRAHPEAAAEPAQEDALRKHPRRVAELRTARSGPGAWQSAVGQREVDAGRVTQGRNGFRIDPRQCTSGGAWRKARLPRVLDQPGG